MREEPLKSNFDVLLLGRCVWRIRSFTLRKLERSKRVEFSHRRIRQHGMMEQDPAPDLRFFGILCRVMTDRDGRGH